MKRIMALFLLTSTIIVIPPLLPSAAASQAYPGLAEIIRNSPIAIVGTIDRIKRDYPPGQKECSKHDTALITVSKVIKNTMPEYNILTGDQIPLSMPVVLKGSVAMRCKELTDQKTEQDYYPGKRFDLGSSGIWILSFDYNTHTFKVPFVNNHLPIMYEKAVLRIIDQLKKESPGEPLRFTYAEPFLFGSGEAYEINLTHSDQVYRLYLYLSDYPTGKASQLEYKPNERNFKSFKNLEPILLKLVRKADKINEGGIVRFKAFKFLGCDDFFKKTLLTFSEDPVWKKYLMESKMKKTNPPYEHIRRRIVETEIFKDLENAFSPLGYRISFSNFEEFSIATVHHFSFFQELKQYGVQPDDRFPIVDGLYFRVYKE